jgi:hypothetical protein
VVVCCAALAILPIVPKPLPAAAATPLPPGWSAVFASLRLPARAAVLVVPIPMSGFTEPLRWQADTGQPGVLVGGYFMGPDARGHADTDGRGLPPPARYLNFLWAESPDGLPRSVAAGPDPASAGYIPVKATSPGQTLAQIAAWRVTAVVAVAARNSVLGDYLTGLLGSPTVAVGDVMAWREAFKGDS